MKKMFLKKLICFVLSLTFSIYPIISTLIAFSKEIDWSALKNSSECVVPVDFVDLWNYIVEKYVFDRCGLKGAPFKGSTIRLTEERLSYLEENYEGIYDNLVFAMYSLADKLLNCEGLCDKEDLEYVTEAKNLAESILDNNGIFSPIDVFLVDFQEGTWELPSNVDAAKKIYYEILMLFNKLQYPPSLFY